MELTIALVISIIGCVLSVASFAVGRKDKAVKDSKEESGNQKLIEYRLTKLEEKLDQVLVKLDTQENETKNIVKDAMEKHVLTYHKEK